MFYNENTDGDLTLRKEIAQQAEHQAKDSDKWRELESVNPNEKTKPKIIQMFLLLKYIPGSEPEDCRQEGRAGRHNLLLQPARGRVRDEDRRADDEAAGANRHLHEAAGRV